MLFKATITSAARHYGTVISHIRQRIGLSQGDFGAMLEGFTQTTISRYESAESEPTLDFWRKFSQYFGLNLTWVFTGESSPYVNDLDNSQWRKRAARFLSANEDREKADARARIRQAIWERWHASYARLRRASRVRLVGFFERQKTRMLKRLEQAGLPGGTEASSGVQHPPLTEPQMNADERRRTNEPALICVHLR